MVDAVVCDRYTGVRDALGQILEADGLTWEPAATAVEAVQVDAVVVVTTLMLADGPPVTLLGSRRQVVVVAWLPADEHSLDLTGAVVLEPGTVRDRLGAEVRAAVAGRGRAVRCTDVPGTSAGPYDPPPDRRRHGY